MYVVDNIGPPRGEMIHNIKTSSLTCLASHSTHQGTQMMIVIISSKETEKGSDV